MFFKNNVKHIRHCFYIRNLKKIAVYNIKGGVGKTTTSVNLACLLARQGQSVLLWDLDPQGGSSYFFNLQNHNNNTHGKLFDRYITIYDVIQHTTSYHIDVISNDAFFSDQFMNKAAKITALNFVNRDLIKMALDEVEDDYDVCVMDCSPGSFMLHNNIFTAADLLLIPNIPAPLSVYCNNMLMENLTAKFPQQHKVLSFYNMVQVTKNLHKHYLDLRNESTARILNSYIPFTAEIESITASKESVFHQLRETKASGSYAVLWSEICDLLRWDNLSIQKGVLYGIQHPSAEPTTGMNSTGTSLPQPVSAIS